MTFIVRGLFDADGLETEMVPVWTPALKPVGTTLTVTDPGVLPEAGVTCSQLDPEVTAAFQGMFTPPLVIWTVCASGPEAFVV